MWIRPLADADASCGAKASGLARLIAAGLRVPDGFVIDSAAFRMLVGGEEPTGAAPDAIGHALAAAELRIEQVQLPADLERDVRQAAAALGRLAVRSSASIEDGALGSAAGVFTSFTDVAPEDVWGAIRGVWRSALTPLAVAYARRRTATADGTRGAAPAPARATMPGGASRIDLTDGPTAGPDASRIDLTEGPSADAARIDLTEGPAPGADASLIAIAVIVQRFVPGTRTTVYTRPPTAPRGNLGDPAQDPIDDALWLQRDGKLERLPRSPAGDRPEAAVALAAEAAIGATGGADVELVVEDVPGALPWIVQARPIVRPVHRRRPAPPPILLAPLVQDGRRWTWDIAHNPDPLSPAQAGLVEHVDRAANTPYALRVCGGYLYTTPREPLQAPAPPADRAELASRIVEIEARFVLEDAPTLAAAIERYVAFMRIWSCELSPLVAAARGRLLERLADTGHPVERIPALAAELIGPRRVLRDRVMAPAWDVAVPTFAEQHTNDPREVAPPVGSSRQLAPEPPRELAADVELARAAADAAERDDIWFARAQWLVRRALLACSAALQLRGDDVFWLPLDELITLRTLDPDDGHRRASAARAAHARAAEWDMPLVIHGDAAPGASSATMSSTMLLRGVGIGPRVVGRVVRFAALRAATPVGRGDIVVTRAITPALAMIVEGCAALVSETGGLLDHGATLARELGITCVVGCTGAWAQLADGVLISVDGDAGLVGLA